MLENIGQQIQTIHDVAKSHDYYSDNCEYTNDVTIYLDQIRGFIGNFIMFDTLVFNKRGYEAWEKLMRTCLNTDIAFIHCSYDVSGYDYWTKLENQSNYMYVAVHLKLSEVEYEDLYRLVEDFLCDIEEKFLHLLTCKSYLRHGRNIEKRPA